MTYFSLLIWFLIPPLLVLAVIVPYKLHAWLLRGGPKPNLQPYWVILAHVVIALVYTTPWDNYLVATNVWWYDPDLVTGIRIGWVPIEEYTFFILQTLLTGLLTVGLIRLFASRPTVHSDNPRIRQLSALVIGLLWLVSTAFLFSGWPSGTYLTLILSWALIPVLLQVLFGMDILLANWRVLILGILPPTLYLWILDAVALRGGTWTIDPLQTTGLMFGVIPIEEMVFFFMTNLIVVFGVILMTSEHSKARANNMIHTIKSRYSQRSISTPDHSKTFSLIHSSAVSSKVLDSETKLQNRKKVLWQLSLLVWIAVLIATPISIWRLGEEVFPILATLGVLAQFTASMAALSMNWSTGRLLTVLFIVILFTWLVEFAGVQFGIPFGSYEYTGLLQPQLADVPLLIPLAWMMMLAPSWAITEVLLRSRIQYLGGEQSSRYRLAFAAVAGLAFTAWDLYLDPMMVGRGLWSWQQSGSYFGIPLSNYLGWWAASAGLTWLVRPTAIRSGQLALIYVLTWLFQAVGLGVFWDQPGPALSGFLGMGAFVALAIYQEGFSWWSSIGAWQGSSAAQSRSR